MSLMVRPEQGADEDVTIIATDAAHGVLLMLVTSRSCFVRMEDPLLGPWTPIIADGFI